MLVKAAGAVTPLQTAQLYFGLSNKSDFESETQNGQKATSSGLEYITVKDGTITKIEIKNKP